MKVNEGMKILLKYQEKLGGKIEIDKFNNLIRSPSPSFNLMLGNGHGLPLGSSTILYGEAKSGKTVLTNAIIGQLHRDDPTAIAVKFDTEMKDSAQLGEKEMAIWGIDKDRYLVFSGTGPDDVFDGFEKAIPTAIEAGANIKLVVIDSITGISGRRSLNADTIMQQQIGDHALTVQEGIKRILPIWRRKGIAVIITAHARAEMDQHEQMRGNKYKMASSYGVKHSMDYFIQIEQNKSSAARILNEGTTDMLGKGEQVAHKIRARVVESAYGPKRRNAEFTFDYNRGLINLGEEVFTLGYGRGVIKKEGLTYKFDGQGWKGKEATIKALDENDGLRAKIMDTLRSHDLNGTLPDFQRKGDDDLTVDLTATEDD